MPHRARAVVVTAPGAPPVVEDIDLVDLVDDEVLVHIAATGICHTDLSCASGALPTQYPVVLGHEAAGIVAACGPRVTRLAEGDRVVVSVSHHCGHCRYCESGYPPLCVSRFIARPRSSWRDGPLLQAYGTGTFATATVLREGSLAPVPDDIPLTVAAVTGCAVTTGVGAVLNDAWVQAGATVAVFGCGGVGASAVMGARACGAARVVAVDPNPVRRRLALEVGATDACPPDLDALRDLEPAGFDYTFESAGRTDAMELAVAVTGPTGTVTLMGLPAPEARLALPVQAFVNANQRILGVNMGRARPHVDFPTYFRLYSAGRLPLDALVSSTVDLEQAPAAFTSAAEGTALRVLLTTGLPLL
jgi:S-(hydroxymethyl)glutathione dehydrogenase/alcohol dehydrogenase